MSIQHEEIVSALKEVSVALTEVRDIDIFLQRIVEISVSATKASRGAILIYDKNKDSLVMRGECGHIPAGYRFKASYEVGNDPNKPKIGLTTYVFLTKKGLHLKSIEEIQKHHAVLGKYTLKRAKEWSGLPLINPSNPEEVFGVYKIIIDEDEDKVFSDTQITIFKELAEIASKVIFISRQRREIINKETKGIIDVLAKDITLEEKLREIVEIFRDISNAEAASIWIIEGDKLRLAEGIGYYDKKKAQEAGINYEYDLSFDPNTADKVGLTAWIAKTGERINIKSNEELKTHPQHQAKYDTINYPNESERRCHSFIGAPLQIGNQIIGIIKADNKIYDANHPEIFFTEDEAEIFYYLAIIAGISIKIDQMSEERQRIAKMIIRAVSHRLRSILPRAEYHLTYLKDNVDKSNFEPYNSVEKALEDFRLAMNIISEYEDFVKPQDVKLDFLNANEVIQAIEMHLKSSFPNVLINRIINVKEGLRLKVNLSKIKEVFTSFVIDSLKIVEKGLQIRLEMISDETSGIVKMTYCDNGPGVLKINKEKIFEPFFTTLGGGGLGLTIAKQIITLHEGRILENGEEGKGVRFEITLPIL